MGEKDHTQKMLIGLFRHKPHPVETKPDYEAPGRGDLDAPCSDRR